MSINKDKYKLQINVTHSAKAKPYRNTVVRETVTKHGLYHEATLAILKHL